MKLAYPVLSGVAVGIFLLLANGAIGSTNELETYLDSMRYYDLQAHAVAIEMELYFGWLWDQKEQMKEAASEAILRLGGIRQEVEALETPQIGEEMERLFLRALTKLEKIYDGVASKDRDTLIREFNVFNDLYLGYELYREELWSEEAKGAALRPSPWFRTNEDRKTYDHAIDLMEKREYAEGYKTLDQLKAKCGCPTATSHFIRLNMADCRIKDFYGRREIASLEFPHKVVLEDLQAIIAEGRYSPVFYDAFLRWRTVTQSYLYGMSSLSQIPNWEYNEKRKELIDVIRDYVGEHREDMWARKQKRLLSSLPNIMRGGPMGSTNLNFWDMLYSDEGQSHSSILGKSNLQAL